MEILSHEAEYYSIKLILVLAQQSTQVCTYELYVCICVSTSVVLYVGLSVYIDITVGGNS